VPQRTAGTLGSAETAPHLPKEAAPAGVLVLRVMATRDTTGCCCVRVRCGLAPDPLPKESARSHDRSARSVFGTRRHGRSGGVMTTPPAHPSAAPACQRAPPRSPGQPRHGRCGLRRFTRPFRPPVPRSGVAPLRSPQSLPYVPPPVKGRARCHCARHSLGRDATMNCLRSPARRSPRIHHLREPHQFTTPSLLCQVGCRGALFALRLARRRWVRASKRSIVR
jgi:hypothetical protein